MSTRKKCYSESCLFSQSLYLSMIMNTLSVKNNIVKGTKLVYGYQDYSTKNQMPFLNMYEPERYTSSQQRLGKNFSNALFEVEQERERNTHKLAVCLKAHQIGKTCSMGSKQSQMTERINSRIEACQSGTVYSTSQPQEVWVPLSDSYQS